MCLVRRDVYHIAVVGIFETLVIFGLQHEIASSVGRQAFLKLQSGVIVSMIVVGVHLRFRIAADAGLTAVAAADAHSAVNVDAVELVERVSERKILIK